jgi:hypothetical protein
MTVGDMVHFLLALRVLATALVVHPTLLGVRTIIAAIITR